ncbi:hypothetical protein FRC05_002627 [Tulasnella sp. 425]|nr:hypothetical protein FRC05_002627 [Tulasnella sp. 425]
MSYVPRGRPRLIAYATLICLLVVFQFRNFLPSSSGNDPQTLKDLHVDDKNATEVQITQEPLYDTLSDAWRKGLTPEEFNDMFERQLAECNAGSASCPENGDKLIPLDWHHFGLAARGSVRGEHICRQETHPPPRSSKIDAMHKLGYSMLLSLGDVVFDHWFKRYHKNVHLVIWEGPKEKIFHASWWNGPVEPLGGSFTLSPEPYNIWPPMQPWGRENYYVGYTVEPTCLNTPFVPLTQRPRQAYILAKYLRFFMDERYPLSDPMGGVPAQFNDDFYLKFSEEEDVTFVAGEFDLFWAQNYTQPPPGITQHPGLQRTEFQKTISQSRVVVGIGNPILSPTPYEALCLGVPFINPIVYWDKNDPSNKNFWEGQHGALIHEGIDEPHVYHVKVGDREGFKAALKKAINTPIDR